MLHAVGKLLIERNFVWGIDTLKRLLLAAAVLVAAINSVESDETGVLGSKQHEAEELFFNYAAARDKVPEDVVVYGYQYHLSAAVNEVAATRGNVSMEREFQFLKATTNAVRGSKEISIRQVCDIHPESLSRCTWWQYMYDSEGRSTRVGNATIKDSSRWGAVNSSELDGEEVSLKYGRYKLGGDTYFASIAHANPFMRNAVTENYGLNLIQRLGISDAQANKDGDIQGVWKSPISGQTLTLTFGGKRRRYPTRAVWRAVDERAGGMRVFTDIATKYDEVTFNNGRKRTKAVVPVQIQRIDYVNGNQPQESHYYFRWKQLPHDFEFPQHNDFDWREPFRVLFDVEPGWPMPTPETHLKVKD